MTLCTEFRIDGNPVVTPDTEVSFSKKDVEASDSGKDESGVLHRFLVRSGVKTWGFNYAFLTQEEYAYMENLFSGKAAFTFTYPKDDGTEGTCRAYCTGGSVAIRNLRTGLYSGYTFNIVEC